MTVQILSELLVCLTT